MWNGDEIGDGSMPAQVRCALWILWAGIVLSVVLALVEFNRDQIDIAALEFIFTAQATCSVISYKLRRRSNVARYIFFAILLASIVLMLSGASGSHAEKTISFLLFISVPLNIFVAWLLFMGAGNKWFARS